MSEVWVKCCGRFNHFGRTSVDAGDLPGRRYVRAFAGLGEFCKACGFEHVYFGTYYYDIHRINGKWVLLAETEQQARMLPDFEERDPEHELRERHADAVRSVR